MDDSKLEKLFTDKVKQALSELETLAQAPNQELRGRPSLKTLERIDHFTSQDDLYQALVAECFTLPNGLNSFEKECRTIFLRIDKLIASNPELSGPAFSEDNRMELYRAAALKLFSDTRDYTPQRTRIQRQSRTEKQSEPTATNGDSLAPPPSDSVITEKKTGNPQQYEADFNNLLKLETSEKEALDSAEKFISGKLSTFNEYVRFVDVFREAQSILDTSSDTILLAVSSIDDSKFGPGCLDDIISIKNLCEKINNSREVSYADASRLLFKLDSFCLAGASCFSPKSLQKEGIITESSRKLLEDIKSIKEPICHRICFGLSHESPISAAGAIRLNKAVQLLQSINLAPHVIEKYLLTSIKGDSSRVQYAVNLAELAVHGVDISKLLDRRGEIVGYVNGLVQGDFDIVSPSDSRYTSILRGAVDQFISISKEENPVLKQALITSLDFLAKNKNYQTFDIIKLLSEYGKKAPIEGLSANIQTLAKSISSLTHGGAPMQAIRNTLLLASQENQLGEKSHEIITGFFEKLEFLQESGVKGLSQLLTDGVVVLKRRAAGDLSQHFSGFLLEAQTAIDFKRLGYHIISMSQDITAKYRYDIVARSPEGQLMGIEVKRTIETFFNKNNSGPNKIDPAAQNQLTRHVLAAKLDKIVPVVALKIGPTHSWAVNLAKEIVKEVEETIGVKPIFIDRSTGRIIPNL